MDPLKYFAFFQYVPTREEYLRFAKSVHVPARYKIIKNRVVAKINRQFLKPTLAKQQISLAKIAKRERLLKLLAAPSWIKYIGLSGSVSMLNAEKKDDLDLFVVTAANRLWTARFWLVSVTELLGVRRRPNEIKYADKLCFNLFFSETDLTIPKPKRTPYIAHEILQLRTIVNKNQTYERLLASNPWIKKILSRVIIPPQKKGLTLRKVRPLSERCLRWLQLQLINRHRTSEMITDTQLWFFPDDFEKKLAKKRPNL